VGDGCRVRRQTRLMFYRIDWSRLMVVLLLLGAGAFIATRLAGAPLTSDGRSRFTPTSHIALRGMWLMTLLGLASGVAGAFTENAVGESAVVLILHGIYSVCWAPAFWMSSLQKALAARDISSRFFSDVFGLLGLLLVPVLWFVVFLGVGHVRGRLRRP